MRLIDEIESLAEQHVKNPYTGPVEHEMAWDMRESPWWPRIREALLAAEEMKENEQHTCQKGGPCKLCLGRARFRAANWGKS